MQAVEIYQLKKSFKQLQVLKNISLNIGRGEFFGLLGPNGAGKTTLISILAGLARADDGFVRIYNHDTVKNYREARKHVGIVPQELVFDPFFTVRETLRIQSGYYGILNNDAWIDELLENLGLMSQANFNTRALSGGMKRRLLIAQALVHRPPVIVLDEPTAGVDVELRQTLWQFITRLNRDGHTIILTTHYLEEAQALCDRVAMMRSGEIIALESMQTLLERFACQKLELTLSNGTNSLPSSLQSRLCSAQKNIETNANANVDEFNSIDQNHKEALSLSSLKKENENLLQKKLIVNADNGSNNEQKYAIRIKNINEIEVILADCRQAGVNIKDINLMKADLEDVFIQLMQAPSV